MAEQPNNDLSIARLTTAGVVIVLLSVVGSITYACDGRTRIMDDCVKAGHAPLECKAAIQ